MDAPQRRYERRESGYQYLLEKQEKLERFLSNLRLIIFTSGVMIIVLTYLRYIQFNFMVTLFLFTVIFGYLVSQHSKIKDKIKYTTILREINTHSLQRLQGKWNTFADDGVEFKDKEHSYTEDLDIFGKNSLFQWISTAQTFKGRQKLAALLSGEVGNREAIRERQEAVAELATMLTWRQRFWAEGMLSLADGPQSKGKPSNPQDLINWGGEKSDVFSDFKVIVLCRVSPLITTALVIIGFGMGIIPGFWPASALLVQAALLSYKRKERDRMFSIAEGFATDLKVYEKMLQRWEKQNFNSRRIQKIKDELRDSQGQKVCKQMERLLALIAPITSRRNVFYTFFNIIALRDFQYMIALEKWKQQSGQAMGKWFDALGEMEALTSLAVIRFDNPAWVLPKICDTHETNKNKPIFEAVGLGHPLLPTQQRKPNDLAFNGEVKVLLITGSNMSGKSTLLRTTGINLVLAYAGAPVCAQSLRVSLMSINTCMRVSDNLGENLSSFYAELLRIKRIVQEAGTGKKVFFLLDEVFKGTNSLDRHTGARVLIKKLSQTNALGLVSTHDFELCDLAQGTEKIVNYHFQEYYQEGKIYFDYQLRPGPSTTRNALYLMKLAGIDLDGEREESDNKGACVRILSKEHKVSYDKQA